ncbi:hypothetical protein FISHEDRAFT_67216 [Fistulina hepatica ATCC 64428]|uniref:Uncharacterized protein n=1 Tax=Fistulina hepatica ATCC 64428 TaxID=1128425 RepID=A0A0D7A2L8_9AGAR|nr:hypothetical protein FISHEDRAFT_67216 [Fistulina hepatica ATCC 64428]
MVFPFTFNFSVPGLSNPFTAQRPHIPLPPATLVRKGSSEHRALPSHCRSPRPAEWPQASLPRSKKRGWEPAFAEPSRSTTTLASSSGYLDTPAKYRDHIAASNGREYLTAGDLDVCEEDLEPPQKRRRGLAGSIVSTALSAALIGTAVGMTVYRLWRDRGKDSAKVHDQTAPPPYQEEEYVNIGRGPKNIYVTPPTPRNRNKARHTASAHRRNVHHRRLQARASALTHPAPRSPRAPTLTVPQPEFDASILPVAEPEPVDDADTHMDWIGGRLAQLIEEGKRALGKEIVVSSEVKEDEEDDGSGNWTDDDGDNGGTLGRRSSVSSGHRGRRGMLGHLPQSPPPSYSTHSTSPSGSYPSGSLPFCPSVSNHGSPSKHASSSQSRYLLPESPRGAGHSKVSSIDSVKEDESTFESPELRESMSRARARYLMKQQGITVSDML